MSTEYLSTIKVRHVVLPQQRQDLEVFCITADYSVSTSRHAARRHHVEVPTIGLLLGGDIREVTDTK